MSRVHVEHYPCWHVAHVWTVVNDTYNIWANHYRYHPSPKIFLSDADRFSSLAMFNDCARAKAAKANRKGFRAEIARRPRKELRSAYMTRLFTIHINRVGRRVGNGRGGYTRGGPLYLPYNAHVVTAMCHSRLGGGGGLKRAPWIFIRGYCEINAGTEETRRERATKRNERSARNPEYVYILPREILKEHGALVLARYRRAD